MSARITPETDFNGLKSTEPTLPRDWYIDPAHHAREMDRLWQRQWIYVCHSGALARPGQFKTFELGTQNILVVRGHDRILRAFHNTCRHRGSILCPAREGRLKGKLITCPYHQWAYALDGRLVATTSHAEASDFDKADYPLYPVAVRERHAMVFICLADADALPDFTNALLRGSERIDNWPLAELVSVYTWQKRMACNWKVFWENFNECLHCPNIHPELCDLVPLYGRRIVAVEDVVDWREHIGSDEPGYRAGLRPGAETWSSDGAAGAITFDTLSDAERSAGQTYFVALPSCFVAAHIDHVRIVRLRPLGPEETEIHAEWLFPPEALAAPGFDHTPCSDFATLVMNQDARACELNQRGFHALPHREGVLMPEEYYVHQFHDWVRSGLAGNQGISD